MKNRIKSQLALSLILIVPGALTMAQTDLPVKWISTTDSKRWVEMEVVNAGNRQTSNVIEIDLNSTDQTIDGFGGCFNELGWEALNLVSYSEKHDILQKLFNPVSGCKFNICRMPLGANDYAINWYSFNETPGDFEMNHFNIARDRLRLIPYIKEAMRIKPDLQVWASPWCPPSWMKVNNHYACRPGGRNGVDNGLTADMQGQEMQDMFIMDDPTLSAYALYFSKFIREYKKEGIDIFAVHVQNEPNSCQNFPSCIWTPESLGTFIGDYLGPKFEEDGLETEIWYGTIERAQPERVDPVLSNPEIVKYITGVGFQWAGKGVIGYIDSTYSDLKLMQTETECGRGTNDWAAMEYTFSLMKHYFINGANSYMYWNMVLDHTGRSQWGWQQNSMITITEDWQVRYNPEFYLMKHFSYFIEAGAKFVRLTADENCLAFLNPDKEIVIIYYNESESPVTKSFAIGGQQLNVQLQEKSLNTITIQM